MRIPHHLTRASSGLWSFRQRVPVDLQPVVGRRTFKRTLQTGDMKGARMRALVLAAGYALAFTVLRERRVSKMTPQEVDELIARLTNNPNSIAELTLQRTRALSSRSCRARAWYPSSELSWLSMSWTTSIT